MAASTAWGTLSKAPVRNSNVTTTSESATSSESCVLAPACSATFERVRAPVTTIPWKNPAPTFDIPSAMSS